MRGPGFLLFFLAAGYRPTLAQPPQISSADLAAETALIQAAKAQFGLQTAKAAGIYEKLLQDFPTNSVADYYLSVIYRDSARWEKALFHALSAVKKEPRVKWYQQHLAQIYLLSGQPRAAIPVLGTCLTLEPDDIGLYRQLIACHEVATDWTGAIRATEALVSRWGETPATLLQKHHLYRKAGNVVGAKREIQRLPSLFPQEEEHFFQAASFFAENGDSEGAKKILQGLLTRNPGSARAAFEVAQLQKTASPLLSLLPFYSDSQVASDRKKNRLEPEFGLLRAGREPSLAEEILQLCAAMETAHPGDPIPLVLRGEVHRIMGDRILAIAAFRAALLIDDSQETVWIQFLEILWDAGQVAILVNEAMKAWDIFPNNPRVPFFAARGYIFQGKTAEAFPLLTEALLQSAADRELHAYGLALEMLALSLDGDREAATARLASLPFLSTRPAIQALAVLAGLGKDMSPWSTYRDSRDEGLIGHARALAALQDKKIDEALRLFEAFESQGTPLFWEHYGDALLAGNRLQDAAKAYQKAADMGHTGASLLQKQKGG